MSSRYPKNRASDAQFLFFQGIASIRNNILRFTLRLLSDTQQMYKVPLTGRASYSALA